MTSTSGDLNCALPSQKDKYVNAKCKLVLRHLLTLGKYKSDELKTTGHFKTTYTPCASTMIQIHCAFEEMSRSEPKPMCKTLLVIV